MKKWVIVGIIVVAVVFVFVMDLLVSHGKKNSNTNTTNSSSTSSQSSSSSSATATDKVDIKSFAFSPTDITVHKGTTVTWTNDDSVAHTVTVDTGDGPNSGNIEPGGKYTFTFNTIGTFTYHCAIHPDMVAKVEVTQ